MNKALRVVRQGPIIPQVLIKVMAKFEATGLSVALERGRNPASGKIEKVVPLAAEEAIIESTHGTWCRSPNGRTMEFGVQNCP